MNSIKRDCVEGIFREEKGAVTRIIAGRYRRGMFFCIPKLRMSLRVSRRMNSESLAGILGEYPNITHPMRMAKQIVRIIAEFSADLSKEDVSKRIMRNPSTIKQLSEQLKLAVDSYFTLRIEEQELQNIILHYARKHCKKMFGKNGKINPTVANLIGKKRRELVELMLRGYQLTVF
jgi:uncharacterized protein (TIGR04540 family)